jgi:hypothetical protein
MMARSLIGENQVVDKDFISDAEHADPNEIPHYFTMAVDTPNTYNGSEGKVLVVSTTVSGIEFTDVLDGGSFL